MRRISNCTTETFVMIVQLSEPSGLVEGGNGKLFIADTNNSIIRFLNLNDKEAQLQTLELKGVQPPSPKFRTFKRLRRRASSDTQVIKTNGSSSTEGTLFLRISVPDGYHFSKEAQSKFDVEIEPDNGVTIEPSKGFLSPEGFASIKFKRSISSPAVGRINCKVYYCKEDEVCLYQSLAFEVPFKNDATESKAAVMLPFTVQPKSPTSSLQLTTKIHIEGPKQLYWQAIDGLFLNQAEIPDRLLNSYLGKRAIDQIKEGSHSVKASEDCRRL
ncbi:hypothetical protein ACLOJK_017552 [Asimina triloba]